MNEEYHNRIAQLPQIIVERSLHDPIIHAAIKQYAYSDMTVEEFLTRLVLMLADTKDRLMQHELKRLEMMPPHMTRL